MVNPGILADGTQCLVAPQSTITSLEVGIPTLFFESKRDVARESRESLDLEIWMGCGQLGGDRVGNHFDKKGES